MESVRSGAKPGRGWLRGPPAPQLLQPLCEEQCQALTLHPASAAAARGPAAFLPASTLLGGVEASSSTGLPLPSHRRMQVFGQPCQDRRGASPSRTLWGAWSCSFCPRCSGFPARYTLPVSHVFLLIYCLIYSWSTCRRALWKAASRLHRFICQEPAV